MIQIEGLKKTYGSFQLEIDMLIPKGRVTGLVGRNGSGKSTTIKAILGLIHPDSGQVRIMGKRAVDLANADRRLLGIAFSDSGFSNSLKLKDLVPILRASYPAFDEEMFLHGCKMARLPMDKLLKEFSTGMNASLRFLTACSHNAKLLILDEPTAGLDVVARNEVLDMLRTYLAGDEERTMLISSHISNDLEGICDDIYMLHDGKIILHEETDKILSEYAVLKISEECYAMIEKQFFIRTKKENYGYACLTDQKQFYAENYPEVVIESGSIDELIIMMEGGA